MGLLSQMQTANATREANRLAREGLTGVERTNELLEQLVGEVRELRAAVEAKG